MLQTLIKNWWLLALCGVFDAIMSAAYLIMQDTGFHAWSTVRFLGRLALAAGICAIVAAIWRSAKGKCWPLALHGLALGALGLILSGIFGSRISFRTIALLIILMALSAGILELATARSLRRHLADEWFLGFAGAVSVGFALVFFAFGFGWIKMGPGSQSSIFWLGSYFGFSAIAWLALGLRLNSLRTAIHRMAV